MAPITTEADWMSCCEPRDLLKTIDRQVNPLRFRWLAIEWGRRIRNVFVPQDLRCFDSFDRWVTADGPHPRDVYEQLQFDYIGEIFWSGGVSAQYCAHAIRNEKYLQAAIYGGLSFSELYPPPLPIPDFSHSYEPHTMEAMERAHFEQWEADGKVYALRVRTELCHQLRDVAGNPFRPVSISSDWLSESVIDLAETIHQDNNFDLLPILADSLEDRGCQDSNYLNHCRSGGPHVRGCWAVLLLLEAHDPNQYSSSPVQSPPAHFA